MEDREEILVVDDRIENLRLLTTLLLDEGYRVRPTQDPNLALKSALANPPNMILLDVRMPGMDGFELCQKLKQDERTAQLPIIFVSAVQEAQDWERAFAAGGLDFISKPIHREELLARVSTHLELFRIRQQLEEHVQELSQSNVRLKELDQLKSLFISSMSHEFRTPLNSIIGFTGVMNMEMAGKLEPKQKDFLKRVQQSSKHLLALINDVIDISKVEAGKIETFNSKFMLDTVIDEAVENVETLRSEKGLELRVDVPDNIQIENDQKRVSQCLLNYLSNAIKYTEKGWISISAGLHSGKAEIVVEDSGIGIAEEDLPKLFQQFVRLDSHLRMKEMGTGLGLYLTKKMASEILGGTVGVESQLGVGSKFYLSIPTNRESHKYGMKVGSPGESDEDGIDN
jgi:two-component system, sensor histidine kinase and response regulator